MPIDPAALELARAALPKIERASRELDDAFEGGRPWYVAIPNGDVAPMVWDASGDAIVSRMPDGTPYMEEACADLIVACVNSAPRLAAALLQAEGEIERLRAKIVSVETTWSEACKADARDCGCWGRIMDLRTKWKETNL